MPSRFRGRSIQRGEQGGGAVALVVVGHRLAPALDHRQRCLGAVECLHGGLLIGAQHDRLLRRIQIEPDDIDQLLSFYRLILFTSRARHAVVGVVPGLLDVFVGYVSHDIGE